MKSKKLPLEKAVALNYPGKGAPRVVAKGQGEVAEQIEMVARGSDVPVFYDPVLTESLANVPLDDEIPETLYIQR